MNRGPSPLAPIVSCLLLALASAVALAACGGDDSGQSLSFELQKEGGEPVFTAPESAEPGEAEIVFVNNTDGESDMQLIRVEGEHTPEEVIEGLEKAIKGQALPDWFFAGGGIGTIEAGEEATATQVLRPGTYYPFSTEEDAGAPDPESVVAVEVSGEESDVELAGDAKVTAAEYVFDAEGLSAGETEVAFENLGAQPHHLLLAPLLGDNTVEDFERALESDDVKEEPIDDEEVQATAVVEGGESQLVELDLQPGRYVFFCFVSDRKGGPPHALKGMIDEFEVE